MAITVLTGLPGSGKSDRLIRTVNKSRESGRRALTFCCSESAILNARKSIAIHRTLSCRSNLSTSIDHFVSTDECIELIKQIPSGSLLAFDEAQFFGDSIVDSWLNAAAHGIDIMIAAPNARQAKMLKQQGIEFVKMPLKCQNCEQNEADTFFVFVDEDRTQSVCQACHDLLRAEAKSEIVVRLRSQEPYPGEERIYQPVELEECSSWDAIRTDSETRYESMIEACSLVGLPGANATYLDIGCNTGFFCHKMRKAGFRATGVDVVANDLEVARLLSTFIRRDYVTYVKSDAYEYLRTTQDQLFDVTSAFSVFQWVMIQNTAAHGLDCMRWMFQKTKKICVLEMGESTEAHYVERIGMKYDKDWVYQFMIDNGDFRNVNVIEKKQKGIKRDFFIGFKN